MSSRPAGQDDAFKKRIEWTFKWVSFNDGDFNYDYQASFRPVDVQRGGVYTSKTNLNEVARKI